MKKYILLILILLTFQSPISAQNCSEIFTIYLVRHSEKDYNTNNSTDPPLTKCGEERSEYLSKFLSDVSIKEVYSTDYIRTKSTALPTATAKALQVKEYNANELEDFSQMLLENKKDVLVVGHSNTTGVLAGILVGEDIGAFDLDIYNRIYQVVIYKNKARLHLLHTAFVCDE
ncbi:MAG: SixA phosphatase family protein [Chitinophagales bacterium]